MKLRVLSLFSGIGSFEKALDKICGGYELVNYCEIDKYASKSYSLIHNVSEEKNLHDVTKIDTSKLEKNIDLITHGSPCQDFSLAGKSAGGDEGSGTRSSLMYETLRIVNDVMPKFVIWENVKSVLNKKHRHNFDKYLSRLDKLGYNNYYEVLNAKDFGIPQNRERIFVVSIRKDCDTGRFKFPKPFELEMTLKDMLEDNPMGKYNLKKLKEFFIKHSFDMETKGNGFRFEPHVKQNANIAKTITTNTGNRMDDNFIIDIDVCMEKFKFDSTNPFVKKVDEKYYLSEAMMKYISADNAKWTENNNKALVNKSIASTINTGEGSRRCDTSNYIAPDINEENVDLKAIRKFGLFDTEKLKHQNGSVDDVNDSSPTLDTIQDGCEQPCILIKNATKQGYLVAHEGDGVNISGRMQHQRGNVQVDSCPTITTAGGNNIGVVITVDKK